MTKNSAHDPLASGEIITAYRMHCDALQASGINSIATDRLRAASMPLILSASDVEQHYSALAKLGIHLTAEQKKYATESITAAGAAVAPNVQVGVQTHTILKLQRSLHGLMIQKRHSNAKETSTATRRSGSSGAHYSTALWASSPLIGHLQLAGWQGQCSGDDGWDDGDELQRGDGGGDQECADDTGFSPQDPYSVAYTQGLLGGTITTPSGAVIQACTVWYAILALGASLAAALAAVAAEGTIIIAGVLITGPALAALLAIIAALAAFFSVVC